MRLLPIQLTRSRPVHVRGVRWLSAMALLLLASCGGGASGGQGPAGSAAGSEVVTPSVEVSALTITATGTSAISTPVVVLAATAPRSATPDVSLRVEGIDGTGARLALAAEGDLGADGVVSAQLAGLPCGTDLFVQVVLANGWVRGGQRVARGAVPVVEGTSTVAVGGPGTDPFERGSALLNLLEPDVRSSKLTLQVAAPIPASEPTRRGDARPTTFTDLGAGLHDRVRPGMSALLWMDRATTWWSITRTQQDKDSYEAQIGYLRDLLLALGFSRVDVTDDIGTSAAALEPYDLLVVTAYNRQVNRDKPTAILEWMERRRGGVILTAGVPSLLSIKYPVGSDIISAGGQTTYDLTSVAGIVGFRGYANASGDGMRTTPNLWRTSGFSGALRWASGSLDAASAVSSRAQVVAEFTRSGVGTGLPWAAVYRKGGEPSYSQPGQVNTADARSVYLSSEPSVASTGSERRGLEAMFCGAVLWAVGAVANLDGSGGPDWGPGSGVTEGFYDPCTTPPAQSQYWDPQSWTVRHTEEELNRYPGLETNLTFRDTNVTENGSGQYALTLPSQVHEGAELKSRARYGYGAFSCSMKCPLAPGSLSSIFLFQGVGEASDEVDIEIYDERTGEADCTVYYRGKPAVWNRKVWLGFDPTQAYHEYKIERRSNTSIEFYVDGRSVALFRPPNPNPTPSDPPAPDSDMHLMLNSWWPAWLYPRRPSGTPLTGPLLVDWVDVR